MINSVKLNDRGQKFVDAEFVLGVEPRSGGLATPWFELDASGKDKGHPRRGRDDRARRRSGVRAPPARRSSSTSMATAISTS